MGAIGGLLIFGCYLLMVRLGRARTAQDGRRTVNAVLLLSSSCLVAGGLLLAYAYASRRPGLAIRLARAEGARERDSAGAGSVSTRRPGSPASVPPTSATCAARAAARRSAGSSQRALVAVALPLVPLLPYAAATGRLPSAGVLLLLALGGFFAPDLVLRSEVKRRREAIFLDLPEAISVLALALGAGQSLRLALELAARDCPGPLGEELTRALSLARRERSLGEREALVRVARGGRADVRPLRRAPPPRRARTSTSFASRRHRRAPSRTATSSAPPTAPTSPCTRQSPRCLPCSCFCSLTASFAFSPRPSSA